MAGCRERSGRALLISERHEGAEARGPPTAECGRLGVSVAAGPQLADRRCEHGGVC